MLLWLLIAVLFTPVLCMDGAPPPDAALAATGAAIVVERLRNEILRRMRRQLKAKQQWAGMLSSWQSPPKPEQQGSKRSNADSATSNQPTTKKPKSAPKPKIDRDARDPGRPFLDAWKTDEEFKDWLEVDANGYVRCSACIAQNKNTNLGEQGGKPVSDAWVRTQLTQHAAGQKHKHAMKERKEDQTAAAALKQGRLSALAQVRSALLVVIQLVYWLCYESVAMLKLESLYQMVRSLPVVSKAFKLLPMHYCNHVRCREFVMALSATIKQELWADILNSPFVSILIDESTDISTSENLIIYFIYEKYGLPVSSYVSLLHAPAVDATSITESLLTFFK